MAPSIVLKKSIFENASNGSERAVIFLKVKMEPKRMKNIEKHYPD